MGWRLNLGRCVDEVGCVIGKGKGKGKGKGAAVTLAREAQGSLLTH